MATNTFRKPQKERNIRFLSFLERLINVEKLFEQGLPVRFLMPILFVTSLCIFYIGNLHLAEKNIRKISQLNIKVEDLRADFTTLKAEYMYTSKQSEVAKKVAALGLIESIDPPYKLVVTTYDP